MADQGPASKKTRFRIDDKDERSDEELNTFDGIQVSLSGSVNNGNEEEINAERFEGSETDSNHIELMGSHQQELEAFNASGLLKSNPMGLTLDITPSLIDRTEMIVSQAKNRNQRDVVHSEQNRAGSEDNAAEKLKPSKFPANLLRIGTWERKPVYKGNLVAKCYFTNHKLIWEMLESDGLKRKIEIEWSHISAIRAIFGKNNEADILEIELSRLPWLFIEKDHQPGKKTTWQPTAINFTGNQASEYRRHYVEFPEGSLKKHYEKMLQCDKRLLELSNKPFPYQNSPFFNFNSTAAALQSHPHMMTSSPSHPPRSPSLNFNTTAATSQFPNMTSFPSPPLPSPCFNFNTAAASQSHPHMMPSFPSRPPRSPCLNFNTAASQFPSMTSIPYLPPRSPYLDFNTAASQFPHMRTSTPSPPPYPPCFNCITAASQFPHMTSIPSPLPRPTYFHFSTVVSQFPHMTSISSRPPRSPSFNFNTAASQFPHMTSIPSPLPRPTYFHFSTIASQFPHMRTSIPSPPPRPTYFHFSTSAPQFSNMTSIPSPRPRSPYLDFNTAASQFPHVRTSTPSPPPLIYSQTADDHLINHDPISAGKAAAAADDTNSSEDFDPLTYLNVETEDDDDDDDDAACVDPHANKVKK